MTDQPVRSQKKTEMIEVRVSHETKRDFLAACERAGRTASDVVRESIDSYIKQQDRPLPATPERKRPFLMSILQPIRRKRYLAAGSVVAGMALMAALPSAAAPGPEATFKGLDANADGVLTIEEFSASPPGTKQMTLRSPQRGATSDPATVYVVLPDADGKAAEQRREVRYQAMGGAAPLSMADRRRADFASYDNNKDGKVDYNEYRDRFSNMLRNGYSKLDKDNSGNLDPNEYQALSATMLSYPADAIPALGVAGSYGPLMTPETLDAAFKGRDANKDGKLSLEEYLPPA
jgi:Ca2+-binding EF-hand superfamily protein